MLSTGFTSPSASLFFLYQPPFSSLCTDEVLLINPSAVFVFGDFSVHHIIKTGLAIPVEVIDLVNYVIIFLSQTTLQGMHPLPHHLQLGGGGGVVGGRGHVILK